MNITPYIKQLLIKQLPYIELCNERIIHQKVHYNKFDFVRVIPKGHKGLLWFKTDKSNNTFCYFISLKKPQLLQNNNFGRTNFNNKYNKYNKNVKHYNKPNITADHIFYIKHFQTSFHKYLTNQSQFASGTILYGTFLKHENVPYFTTEDILYYKGSTCFNKNWSEKLSYIQEVLTTYIHNNIHTKNSIVILSAFTKKLPCSISDITNDVPYEIYSTQYFSMNKNSIYTKKYVNKSISTKIFYVLPSIQDDIYEIYDTFNNSTIKHDENNNSLGFLHISSYKTSVMMNNIFRIIKENDNLDYLEESDDEEEFENINIDKFVDLKKCIPMECSYNIKHKMWEPIRVYKQ